MPGVVHSKILRSLAAAWVTVAVTVTGEPSLTGFCETESDTAGQSGRFLTSLVHSFDFL